MCPFSLPCYTFCTVTCNTLPFRRSGGRFWLERHSDGQGGKGGTDQPVSGSSFSRNIYNLCSSFVTKGGKKITANPCETCCLHPLTTDPQKTTLLTIWHRMPLCNPSFVQFSFVHSQVIFYALEKPTHKVTTLWNTSKLHGGGGNTKTTNREIYFHDVSSTWFLFAIIQRKNVLICIQLNIF